VGEDGNFASAVAVGRFVGGPVRAGGGFDRDVEGRKEGQCGVEKAPNLDEVAKKRQRHEGSGKWRGKLGQRRGIVKGEE